MAGLFFDSFDHYATANITQKWTQIAGFPTVSPAVTASVGRRSTNAMRWASVFASAKSIYKTVPASGAIAIVGFSFNQSSGSFTSLQAGTSSDPNTEGGTQSPGLLYIQEGSTTHVWFRLNSTGTISAFNGGSGTALGTSSSGLSAGVTSYLEFKVTIDNSSGTIDVLKDGVSILSLTSKDTQNGGTATWTQFAIGHAAGNGVSGVTWDYDDLYVLDGSGSVNNNFLGDIRVDATYGNGAGTNTGWTPSTGSNYQTVDETATNGDTDYNSTSTVNAKDSFAFPSAPVAGAVIAAIQVNIAARKTDAGTSGIKPLVRISGTDNLGVEQFASSSFSYLRTVWDQTPEGSPQTWTDTIYDAAEFGYEKST